MRGFRTLRAFDSSRRGGRAGAGTLYVVPGVPLLPNFGIVRRRGRGVPRLKKYRRSGV